MYLFILTLFFLMTLRDIQFHIEIISRERLMHHIIYFDSQYIIFILDKSK